MERLAMRLLFCLWDSIRQYLIPCVEESLESLSETEAEFVRAAELADVDRLARAYMWKGCGRNPSIGRRSCWPSLPRPYGTTRPPGADRLLQGEQGQA